MVKIINAVKVQTHGKFYSVDGKPLKKWLTYKTNIAQQLYMHVANHKNKKFKHSPTYPW